MNLWHDIKLLNAISGLLLGAFVLLLLAGSVWWVIQRPMFGLKVIQIEGVSGGALRHVNPSTVKSVALVHMKGNFFTVNLDTVRLALESVPWVRSATVRRAWPNRLIATLEEHTLLGAWGNDGRLLSVKGDVFTANLGEAEEEGKLPEFFGPPGSEKEVVARFQELHAWFAPVHLSPDAVWLSGRYAWTVRLNNGITVELGREQNKTTLKERASRLVQAYPQLVARLQNRIARIDMRYPNGMAFGVVPTLGQESQKK